MPKRERQEESKTERWLRKKKKYEQKLEEKNRREKNTYYYNIIHSDDCETEVNREEDDNNGSLDPKVCASGEIFDPAGRDVAIVAENLVADPTDADGGSLHGPTAAADISEGGKNEDAVTTDDFDPSLLKELGDLEADPVEYGDDLQTDLARGFQKILLDGLKKETKEELLKKYLYPKNVPLAKGPTLNPEVSTMLVETCKQRDKRLLTKQDQMGKALSAIGKALSNLLKKSPDIPEVIRTLNDAGKLIADSHHAETDTRRSVIIPLIDKSLSEPFKDRKRDSFLFGEKLGDLVKDSRGIKKTGQLIQASNLNARGSSARSARPQQRSGQPYPPRAGGPRPSSAYLQSQSYQSTRGYSRRATGPPLPPPARRLPPPLPPLSRRSQAPAAPRTSR